MDFNEIMGMIENMTPGAILYYGGFAGVGLGIFLILLCSIIFPIQRKRRLRKLGEE